MKNGIENTTRTAEVDPMLTFARHAFGGGVEASERRGQQQLIESDVLPVDTRNQDAAYEALGFSFGAPVDGDTMFRAATLPDGWKREGSDHAMWSYIVDQRGLRRVAVFYKAAFYDRSAHMDISNVGGEQVSEALYGDGEITRASLRWDDLTETERAAAVASIDYMATRIVESPGIYGKYAPRLAAVREAIA